MIDPVEASLNIKLNVECPYCENYFDLLQYEGLNDDGEIISQACPDGHWSEEHRKFDEKVKCPECKKEIAIKGIAW